MATKNFACAPKPAPPPQQDVGEAITGQAARSASAPSDAKIKAVNSSVSLVRQVERKVIDLKDRLLKTNFSNFVDVASDSRRSGSAGDVRALHRQRPERQMTAGSVGEDAMRAIGEVSRDQAEVLVEEVREEFGDELAAARLARRPAKKTIRNVSLTSDVVAELEAKKFELRRQGIIVSFSALVDVGMKLLIAERDLLAVLTRYDAVSEPGE
jgi:hypothetical protein